MDLKQAVYGVQTYETRIFILIQYIYIRKGVDISNKINPILSPIKLHILSDYAINWLKQNHNFE